MSGLVARVAAAGFRIDVTEHGPRLVPVRDGARMPHELLTEVKENRGEILLFLASGREAETEGERCGVCQRTLFGVGPKRLSDPAFCDRGGAKAVTSKATGEVVVPAEPRCPYKP